VANPSKDKGSAFEREVVAHLNRWEFGEHAERRKAGMTDDRGDVVGVPDLAIECKNHKDVAAALRLGVDALPDEMRHSHARFGVAVVKRARKPVEDAYAVMTLRNWCALWQLFRWQQDEIKSKDQALRGAITQLAVAQAEAGKGD
jgi:Holliday junction resolvase